MRFLGIYIGIVEKVNDPERLGRLKIRVPSAYGVLGSGTGAVPVDDLPWALPMGLPAGGSPKSGGADWLPQVNDQVVVQFLDGEPEKPVWSWLMQTIPAAKDFPLHSYAEVNGQVGDPKRGAWTRYGHTVEWNDGSLVLTTKSGYRLFLLDGTADGRATLSTQLGQFLEFDDSTKAATLNVIEDFYVVVGAEINALSNSLRMETISGAALTVGTDLDLTVGGSLAVSSAANMALVADADVNLEAGHALTLRSVDASLIDFGTTLNFGATATEPFVLGRQLTLFLNSLMQWLMQHTHSNGNNGSPTGPPIVPPNTVVRPDTQLLTSQTIFGK